MQGRSKKFLGEEGAAKNRLNFASVPPLMLKMLFPHPRYFRAIMGHL